ncbi:fungal-specific transcription factor domain-containing protein [Apiospora arundinis]
MATTTAVNGTGGSGAAASAAPKAIRFVNNQGQPPQKRRRINAACLTCRKRKTRCDGEHPTCHTCSKNGHVCLGYSDAAERKKDPISGQILDATSDNDDDLDERRDEERQQWRSSKSAARQHSSTASLDSSRRFSESTRSTALPSSSTVRPKQESIDWEDRHTSSQNGSISMAGRPATVRNSSFSTEDGRSPSIRSPVLQHHSSEGYRVPYFRYFGPTAIVPGFKQMVVKVRNRRRSSMTATSPSSGATYTGFLNSGQSDQSAAHPDDMPVYDPNDPDPVDPLILNLVDTFFDHQGCNYPFLRRDDFTRLVKLKQVEPILVDAVCALAARFFDSPVFGNGPKAERGQVFAQRAKAATVDTFPCPSVAAVQACLLMAYEGFGADQDSALWMYLGLAIRMAIDLGLHKKDGVRFQGEKDPWYARSSNRKPSDEDSNKMSDSEDTLSPQEQKKLEQERIDTLWSVFILDRVISSGTGRPVTLRDDDFELDFPKSTKNKNDGWPDPFPSLIQIIHLYGRVSDVLNKLRGTKDLTPERMNSLLHMEKELTRLHQKQDPRLRFDATNFQHYVGNGQGTPFILLHFWFHALIIVLHQPTLLTPLERLNQDHPLLPHSRELSMSSAKTIADILAFAKLIDEKSFIGNPFTSQPIYIAACAFLKESVAHPSSQPASREASPLRDQQGMMGRATGGKSVNGVEHKPSDRHFLLASAANQNYQSCYKALQQMQIYWGGIRYILTALDQKFAGTWDCETYTREEYESTKQPRRNDIHRFLVKDENYPTSPTVPPLAWSLTGTTNSPNSSLTLLFQNPVTQQHMDMAPMPTSQSAPAPTSAPTPPGNMIYDPIRQSLPETTVQMYPPAYPQPNTSALRHSINPHRARRVSSSSGPNKSLLRYDNLSEDGVKTPTTPDGKFSLALASQGSSVTINSASYTPTSQHSSAFDQPMYPTGASPSSTLTEIHPSSAHGGGGGQQPSYIRGASGGTNSVGTPATNNGGGSVFNPADSGGGGPSAFASTNNGLASSGYSYLGPNGQGMHLVTIDNESDFTQHLTSFESSDMLSWFGEYLPSDVGLFTDMTGNGLP